MQYRYEELAGMIDHSLLHPTLTDKELEEGCKLAARYEVASVCIKPHAVKQAAQWLAGSLVKVGTVVGFPHGNSLPEVKRMETRLACRDGAVEIDMVINPGKALGGNWEDVSAEIQGVCEEAHSHGAKVKVILETDYLRHGGAGLTREELVAKLCQIAEAAGADWVKTSSGFAFVKQPGGGYNYCGATEQDLQVMLASVSPNVQVKASGGIRDLDALIKVRELGATRCGASATKAMLDEYRRREKAEQNGVAAIPTAGVLGAGGY